MSQENTKKKSGRPPVRPENKAIKPNVTISPSLERDGIEAAEREGISWSAFVTQAINKEIARSEMRQPGELSSVKSGEDSVESKAKSSRFGHA